MLTEEELSIADPAERVETIMNAIGDFASHVQMSGGDSYGPKAHQELNHIEDLLRAWIGDEYD